MRCPCLRSSLCIRIIPLHQDTMSFSFHAYHVESCILESCSLGGVGVGVGVVGSRETPDFLTSPCLELVVEIIVSPNATTQLMTASTNWSAGADVYSELHPHPPCRSNAHNSLVVRDEEKFCFFRRTWTDEKKLTTHPSNRQSEGWAVRVGSHVHILRARQG